MNPRGFLPGTVRATDRFVRADFFINAVPQSEAPRIAAASVLGVLRATSVPRGIGVEGSPNLSTTRWRVVADQKDRRYCAVSVVSPSLFRVDLENLDFPEGAPVGKPDLGTDMSRLLSGEVSGDFVPAEPFAFQPAM